MDSIILLVHLVCLCLCSLSTNIFALQATSGVRACVDVWQVYIATPQHSIIMANANQTKKDGSTDIS